MHVACTHDVVVRGSSGRAWAGSYLEDVAPTPEALHVLLGMEPAALALGTGSSSSGGGGGPTGGESGGGKGGKKGGGDSGGDESGGKSVSMADEWADPDE